MFQLKLIPLRVTFRYVRAEVIGSEMSFTAQGWLINITATTVELYVLFSRHTNI